MYKNVRRFKVKQYKVQGHKVNRRFYKIYHEMRESQRYADSVYYNSKLSLDLMEENGMVWNAHSPSIEDNMDNDEKNKYSEQMLKKMKKIIKTLEPEYQELLY